MKVRWNGVFPALTTHFRADESLDLAATAAHLERMIQAGVQGVILLGSVGENTSLDQEEKRILLREMLPVVRGRVPVLAGVAECSTRMACRFARDAEQIGADGLMVLPALVYAADSREVPAYFRSVARSSGLPIMIYNNPASYGVDVKPEVLAELAAEPSIVAVKESSQDPRRITDLIRLTGDRFVIFCGIDDVVLESVLLGARGWVAGLVNAFPAESCTLWELASSGRWEEARRLYRWFAPLLHLDTHPKLVQCIKLAMAEVGLGAETVRAPRLALEGAERDQVLSIIRQALASRPALPAC